MTISLILNLTDKGEWQGSVVAQQGERRRMSSPIFSPTLEVAFREARIAACILVEMPELKQDL